MAALFTPRTASRFRRALAVAGAVPVVVVVTVLVLVRTPLATGQTQTVAQPMPFDHRIHTVGLAIDCRYCHAGAEHTASAGMPPTRACVACHNESWQASGTFAPVRASLATGRPIPWRRVHSLPDFVFFNHAVHVSTGVGCETCHGRVDRMRIVRQAAPLTMAWCLDCHRNPASHLRPTSEITTMGWTPAGPATAAISPPAVTTCSGCHR